MIEAIFKTAGLLAGVFLALWLLGSAFAVFDRKDGRTN